jgi:hypothetical protein
MRAILVVVCVALSPTLTSAAEQPAQQTRKPPVTQSPVNPCAAYGAGFVQIAGTSTCVKVGGHISVEVGGRAR